MGLLHWLRVAAYVAKRRHKKVSKLNSALAAMINIHCGQIGKK